MLEEFLSGGAASSCARTRSSLAQWICRTESLTDPRTNEYVGFLLEGVGKLPAAQRVSGVTALLREMEAQFTFAGDPAPEWLQQLIGSTERSS
jgi:hypothetical protein